MVVIRLRRQGKTKQPSYRLVVADSRSPRDGKFIEIIGHYNPVRQPKELVIKGDRARYWIGVGVQPSDTVRTGADGSVGITMNDDSTLSAGPNSVFSFDRYAFDTTTNKGQFDTSLKRGSLAVISGRIAKESPDAMKVRTPAAMLGVRGTEFVVRAAPVTP